MLHNHTLTLNRNPGGMSALSDEAPPSTVPLTVAGKVSTTTAGRELWEAVAAKEGKKTIEKRESKTEAPSPTWRIQTPTIPWLQ